MKPRTRIILLSVISILIVVIIVLGVTYSFMQANIDSSEVTEVTLSSCAKITLSDTEASIDLSNTSPISKNRALETTPYTFTVTSSCESYVGFNLYLATLNTNTLVDSSIHYIITSQGSKDILAEGILSEATNALSEFTSEEQTQLNSGINGTFATIYRLYNDSIPLQGEVSYDLYLYIDSDVTDASTMGKTFNAGIAVKSYDREAMLADICNSGDNLANCIKEYNTMAGDGAEGIYYHDGQGTYTNADQEAGDNSYRYSGANPNNYVCFGSDEETCPEENLYRIIGIFDDDKDTNYQIKLIKADYTTSDMLGTDGRDYNGAYSSLTSNYKGSMDTSTIAEYRWNYDTSVSEWGSDNWTTSEFNTINLNTNYWNYLGSTWQNLIAPTTWNLGGMTSYNNTAKAFYDGERNNAGYGSNPTTYTDEIGLMYPSDYGYAASPDAWATNLFNYNNSTITSNNWLYMGLYEWTITPCSSLIGVVFFVGSNGRFSDGGADVGYAARPVFYLKSNVALQGGSGTSSDPYRLAV